MAFVKVQPKPYRARADGAGIPIEFGVGRRSGVAGQPILDVKIRLRPKLLLAAQPFLVLNTWFDVAFDAESRMLLIEPGADFKLHRPGGPVNDMSPLILSIPLLEGLKASAFCLPVMTFTVTGQKLTFTIPRAAFQVQQLAPYTDRERPATRPPAPVIAAPNGKMPAFESALAGVPHNTRRGT